MKTLMLSGVAALALSAAPAWAQDTGSGEAPDQAMRDQAMQSAEGAGMQDVGDVPGAFVLQGTTAAGVPVMMIVGPTGELLALAAPVGAFQPASGEAPQPGEPAESGYMATQAQPASPQVWDPALVEAAVKSLELGMRGAAGEVSQPSQ
jgi:hypothetical protein